MPLSIYGDSRSGNCYKTKLLATHLDVPFAWHEVDVIQGEAKTESFRLKNPLGKVPVLELEDGRCLAESNAILMYLGEGSAYVPKDSWQRAQMVQWLFFEQYDHEPTIAVNRAIKHLLGSPTERQAQFDANVPKGYAALDRMEQQLGQTDFLVGDACTLADFALFAYTHVAEDGGFSLENYPGIRAWIGRIASHPKHVAMG